MKSEKKKHEVIIPDMRQVEGEMQRLGLSPNGNVLSGIHTSEKLSARVMNTVSQSSENLKEKLKPLVKPVAEKEPGDGAGVAASEIPALSEVEKEIHRISYRRKFLHTLWTTLSVIIIAAAIAVLVATMFTPVLQVSGSSMEPTLENSDVIIMLKQGDLKTGDVCGFYYQNKLLLKRVIGTPGDIINMDEAGNVTVNGVLLDEPYLSVKSLGECDISFPCQVPDNRYFVLGDNRDVSIDSRSSTVGYIEKEQMVGKAILRVYPRISRVGK